MKSPDTLSSTEDELFHEPRNPKGSGWWKWALAIILGALFVYRSTRPVVRLRSTPPPSFYDYSRTWTQVERQQHRHLADAYWQVAVRRIQGHYSADAPLPSEPPPQFRLGSSDSDVAASRVHYWFRLREVWSQPNAWSVSYGWNTDWVERAVSSIRQYIPQWLLDIFQSIVIFFDGLAQKISLA